MLLDHQSPDLGRGRSRDALAAIGCEHCFDPATSDLFKTEEDTVTPLLPKSYRTDASGMHLPVSHGGTSVPCLLSEAGRPVLSAALPRITATRGHFVMKPGESCSAKLDMGISIFNLGITRNS